MGEPTQRFETEYFTAVIADTRAAYRLPHVILIVVFFLVTTAGTQMTFNDPRCDNVLGYAAIATPSILAAYGPIAWL